MEIPKILILLCYAYQIYASHEGHTIPIENYETELHDLGEHVDFSETPVKVIKITKTVAVKVPVPYPVKVIEKVPYPVHISKPYPVPVPHIVKVPHVASPKTLHAHEALGSDDGTNLAGHQDNYEVQEIHTKDAPFNGYDSYNGGLSSHTKHFAPYGDDYFLEGSSGNSYDAPAHNYYSNAGTNNADSFETKRYDDSVKNDLRNINSLENSNHGLQNSNYYH